MLIDTTDALITKQRKLSYGTIVYMQWCLGVFS